MPTTQASWFVWMRPYKWEPSCVNCALLMHRMWQSLENRGAECGEHSPANNVSMWVWHTDPASYVGWVCCKLVLSLLWEVFLWVLCPNTNISKLQFNCFTSTLITATSLMFAHLRSIFVIPSKVLVRFHCKSYTWQHNLYLPCKISNLQRLRSPWDYWLSMTAQ